MNIPNSFTNRGSDYITLPAMKNFCNSKNIKNCSNLPRVDVLNEIIRYADSSSDNYRQVESWIYKVLREGIKHIYLKEIYFNSALKNIDFFNNLIAIKLPNFNNESILTTNCSHNYQIRQIDMKTKNNQICKLEIYINIRLLEGKSGQNGNKLIYPIFVDLDLENNLIIARAKSKSSTYFYDGTDTIIDDEKKASISKLLVDAIEIISNIFNLTLNNQNESKLEFKKTYYNLLRKYTYTPLEIEEKLSTLTNNINEFILNNFESLAIDLNLYYDNTPNFQSEDIFSHAKQDLKIFFEKYISITTEDKKIFKKDRVAYPIKLKTLDEEYTIIEQTSASYEPLQCKAAFFDNKKSLEREKNCEKIQLCYNRTMIHGKKVSNFDNMVLTNIEVDKKGFGIIIFPKYTSQEEVDYVLSDIIQCSALQD